MFKLPSLQAGIVLAVLAAVLVVTPVSADTSPALSEQKATDQVQMDGVEDQITSIQARVAQLDQNIHQIEQKKAEIAGQIKGLEGDSNRLLPDLQAKAAAYRKKQGQLTQAIEIDYKSGHRDTLSLLVGGSTISKTLNKLTYFASVEKQIDQLAQDAQDAREDVESKKHDLDSKRSTQELAKRQIVALEASLGQQKTEQQELLANKSNEAEYLAARIKRAEEAEQAILHGGNAIWGTFQDGAQVKQGDVIGFEGSTGFSTGCHTHFSVIEGGQWIDPKPFIDVGTLRRPAGEVVQAFGMTAWARSGAYGGRIHNGVDFVQPCGSPVRAAKDGIVIRDNRTDGSGFGHYIMIRHDNGLITLYGHLI